MSQNQVKAALTYIREVLGIEGFAMPEGETFATSDVAPASALSTPELYLFISAYSANEAALIEMQNRMVIALKHSISDFGFKNLEQTNVQLDDLMNSKVVIVFGANALAMLPAQLELNSLKFGEIEQVGALKILLTHSLTDLANSAPLKKDTWSHLQSVF